MTMIMMMMMLTIMKITEVIMIGMAPMRNKRYYDANEPHEDGDGAGQNEKDDSDILMLDFITMKPSTGKRIRRV